MNPLLRELQEHLQSYILQGDTHIENQIVTTGRLTARLRLDIYAAAYRLRLLEALEADFPALYALVAKEEFSKLGEGYIQAYPSHSFSLRHFGGHLSAFLASTPPYCHKPWLAEMAGFEWALGEAFDAADSPITLTIADISAVPPIYWAEMRLCLQPSVQRLDLHWNVPLLWKTIDRQETPGTPVESKIPIPWVLWRQELKNYFRSLKEDEAWAVDTALAGETFGAICEGLCRWHQDTEVARQAARLLQRWVTEGWLIGIDPASESREEPL
jgi:Putative DNA-binding domain